MSSARIDRNRELARRYCEAWAANDLATVFNCYTEDFTLHYFGNSRFAGDHVGRDQVIATLASIQQVSNRELLEVVDHLASEDRVAVVARERFERDGNEVETTRIFLYAVRDGKFADAWLFDQEQQALDELWG